MPIIQKDDYSPSILFRNGHLNTLYPALFRKLAPVDFRRIRLTTPDDDFLDIDTILNNNKHLAVICHGLEGSSNSQYIQSISGLLSKSDLDVIAINFRSCSGEMNKNARMYHSGETEDLEFVIDQFCERYEQISLIGYSLGANVILKYLGINAQKINIKITNAVGVSVPVDLEAGAYHLRKLENRIYEKKFLQSLKLKIQEKHKLFPNQFDISKLDEIDTLIDFDDVFTGPIHGFSGAHDYYNKSNSKQFLHNIRIPSLILTALDDPFLPKECYPFEEAKASDHLNLLATKYGGHVGFTSLGNEHYWSDHIILQFITNQLV